MAPSRLTLSNETGPMKNTIIEQGLPSSLLLENSEGDRFVLLPSATLPGRPESNVSVTSVTVAVLCCLGRVVLSGLYIKKRCGVVLG